MLLIAAASIAASSQNDWKDAGTKDGVVLAYRDDPVLAAREVCATTELPFSAQQIVALVCDFTNYKDLEPGVQDARLIAGTLPTDYEIYLRYSSRYVVVAARDVVLRVQRDPPATGIGCNWSEVSGREVERKGIVRMSMLRGTWKIEPVDATRSRVTYQIAVKPGGSIPGWLVRRGAISALPEVIERVRRRLAEG